MEAPIMTMKAPSSDGPHELRQLEQLCLPSWTKHRSNTITIRPERPEYTTLVRGAKPNKTWHKVLRDLHAGLIRSGGNGTVDDFVANICPARRTTTSSRHVKDVLRPVLSAVAAIRWELESRNRTPLGSVTGHGGVSAQTAPRLLYQLNRDIKPVVAWPIGKECRGFLTHLLLGDFAPYGKVLAAPTPTDERYWDELLHIAGQLVDFAFICGHVAPPWGLFVKMSNLLKQLAGDMDPTDVAVALCQALYYSRAIIGQGGQLRRVNNGSKHRCGLGEMLGDACHGKRERLQRKLSVDVHEMLPRLIKDKGVRQEIESEIQRTAWKKGISIYGDTWIKNRPGPEACYVYGRLIKEAAMRLGSQGRMKIKKVEKVAKTLRGLVTTSETRRIGSTWTGEEKN